MRVLVCWWVIYITHQLPKEGMKTRYALVRRESNRKLTGMKEHNVDGHQWAMVVAVVGVAILLAFCCCDKLTQGGGRHCILHVTIHNWGMLGLKQELKENYREMLLSSVLPGSLTGCLAPFPSNSAYLPRASVAHSGQGSLTSIIS